MDFADILSNPLALALGISMLIQLFFFTIAAIRKTDMFTDLSYGITFVIVAWYALFSAQYTTDPKWIIVAIITLWGVRLAGYLFMRILAIKKDRRFDGIREDPLRFGMFWLFQGISVWVIMLPALALIGLTQNKEIFPLSWIGAFIAVLGLLIETIADQQKFNFKNENPKKWADIGLWKYSRHPNYFGEMLVWWGIFVFVAPYLEGLEYLVLAGPLWITTLLLFITGIPTIESRYDKKYADNSEYQEYKRKTSLLIPLPPKK
jgi:steroid 5-alpha reductase family enzyme